MIVAAFVTAGCYFCCIFVAAGWLLLFCKSHFKLWRSCHRLLLLLVLLLIACCRQLLVVVDLFYYTVAVTVVWLVAAFVTAGWHCYFVTAGWLLPPVDSWLLILFIMLSPCCAVFVAAVVAARLLLLLLSTPVDCCCWCWRWFNFTVSATSCCCCLCRHWLVLAIIDCCNYIFLLCCCGNCAVISCSFCHRHPRLLLLSPPVAVFCVAVGCCRFLQPAAVAILSPPCSFVTTGCCCCFCRHRLIIAAFSPKVVVLMMPQRSLCHDCGDTFESWWWLSFELPASSSSTPVNWCLTQFGWADTRKSIRQMICRSK